MTAVAIGPLVLDGMRFASFVGILIFLIIAAIADRRARHQHGTSEISLRAGHLLLVWALGARLAYVAENWPAYAEDPMDILRIWQGGFSVSWGFALTILAALILVQRGTGSFGPLALAGGLAVAAGSLTTFLLFDPAVSRLPETPLVNLSGEEVWLSGTGEPMVLNLWASWCPPCRREMPMMVEAAAAPGAPRFVFANQGEDLARIQSFLKVTELPGTDMVQDPSSSLMGGLGAFGLPLTMFFAADGRLIAAHTGEISRAELMRRMTEITRETN